MSSLSRAATAFAVCALSLAVASPVAAQEPGSVAVPLMEISGGYMFMRDTSSELPNNGMNFPAGWYFSGALTPGTWYGVVGEASGSYKDNFDMSVDGYTFSNDARVYTFMGGPKFFHKVGRVVPFGQVLAGVAHMRLRTTFPQAIPLGTLKAQSTNVAVQPGAGVTVLLTDHVGLRVAGDYRAIVDFVTDAQNEVTNEFRVVTGFTLQWGRR
jgi:hypothetical protein